MSVLLSAVGTRFQLRLYSHHRPTFLLGLGGPTYSLTLWPLGLLSSREEFVWTSAGGPPSEPVSSGAVINGEACRSFRL